MCVRACVRADVRGYIPMCALLGFLISYDITYGPMDFSHLMRMFTIPGPYFSFTRSSDNRRVHNHVIDRNQATLQVSVGSISHCLAHFVYGGTPSESVWVISPHLRLAYLGNFHSNGLQAVVRTLHLSPYM